MRHLNIWTLLIILFFKHVCVWTKSIILNFLIIFVFFNITTLFVWIDIFIGFCNSIWGNSLITTFLFTKFLGNILIENWFSLLIVYLFNFLRFAYFGIDLDKSVFHYSRQSTRTIFRRIIVKKLWFIFGYKCILVLNLQI